MAIAKEMLENIMDFISIFCLFKKMREKYTAINMKTASIKSFWVENDCAIIIVRQENIKTDRKLIFLLKLQSLKILNKTIKHKRKAVHCTRKTSLSLLVNKIIHNKPTSAFTGMVNCLKLLV